MKTIKRPSLSQNKITMSRTRSIIILVTLYSLIFLVSPYFRGLFFNENYYYVNILLQVVFLGSVIFLYKPFIEYIQNQLTIALLSFLAICTYILSYLSSVAPSLAANEMLRWISYLLVFLMLSVWLSRDKENVRKWLWYVWVLAVVWITGFVYLVDFKVLSFTNAILGANDRFSSVFQYPNTFASITSALLIALLIKLSSKMSRTHLYIYGLISIPVAVAFLLADSRGGFLVVLLVWLVALFFLTWKQQIVFVLNSVVLVGLGFAGYSLYQTNMGNENMFMAVICLVVLSLLFLIVNLFIQKYIEKWQDVALNNKLNLIMPIAFVSGLALTVVLLSTKLLNVLERIIPEGIYSRIQNINFEQHSVQERLIFYKDAFYVWLDHFWLGAGGGGWRALFEQYKSLPYYSTQAHSYYMQTLVEVGLIGSIIIFGFFGYIIIKGIRTYYKNERVQDQDQLLAPAILIVLTLLLHNTIDFNMSFGTYNLFLFTILAMIYSYVDSKKEDEWIKKAFGKLRVTNERLIPNVIVVILVILSIFTMYKSYAFSKANSIYEEATRIGGDFNTLARNVEQAVSLDSKNPNLRELRIRVLEHGYENTHNPQFLDEIDAEYQVMLKVNPTNHLYYQWYAEFLWGIGKQDEALEQLKKALHYAPWIQEVYEDNVKYTHQYILNNILDAEAEQVYLKEVLDQLENKMQIQQGDLPPGLNLTLPIKYTDQNRIIFGKAYYYLGKHEESLELLESIDSSNLFEGDLIEYFILKALNFEYLNDQSSLAELLDSEQSKEMYLNEMFEQAKQDITWQPYRLQ